MSSKSHRLLTWIATGALAAGVGIGTAGVASAASTKSSPATHSTSRSTSTHVKTISLANIKHGLDDTLVKGVERRSANDAVRASVGGVSARVEVQTSDTSIN